MKKKVSALIKGGSATAGPPLGPLLGPLGLNVMAVVNRINELTKEYEGMKVPVDIIVDLDTKEFQVEVKLPSTSALIMKELRGKSDRNLTIQQVADIARKKLDHSLSKSLVKAVKEVLGTCLSMNVTVEGKSPKQVSVELDEGLYNDLLKE